MVRFIHVDTFGCSSFKNAISEINNTLGGINSRLDEEEDRISILEDKVEINTQAEQQNTIIIIIFKKQGELKKHFGQHEV